MLTAVLIGLRYKVGGDWFNYIEMQNAIGLLSFEDAISFTDPAYAFLNWLSNRAGVGIWFTNIVCATIFMVGLGRLAGLQPNPPLAILVAVPYFIIVVAMGYTRQAAAIGVICYGLATFPENRIQRLIILVFVAALFHKSAIVIMPILLIPIFRKNILFAIASSAVTIIIVFVLLANSADSLIAGYIASDLESQGALIRVSMNVIAAIIFIMLRDRFRFTPFVQTYWMTNAVLSIVSLACLGIGVGSTAIDRLALFLIPLQIVVFAHLPYVLSKRNGALPSILLGVIGYSFLVQLVWLNFADNSHSWVPYSTTILQDDF